VIIKQDNIKNLLPNSGRLISLDVGTKRIGVAICDDKRIIATPKLIINRQSNLKDFTQIMQLIIENTIVAVIIGLPIDINGNSTAVSKFVNNFAINLDCFLQAKLNTEIPIILFDERFSSFEARRIVKSKIYSKKTKFYDDISANIILEHFLKDYQ
jgi:putative Holliday junction resolvase